MWKRTAAALGLTLTLTLVGACGASQKDSREPAAPASEAAPVAADADNMEKDMSCPFSDPGVEVAVEDVDGGVSLTITGSEDKVAYLRRWGHKRAAMASGGTMPSQPNKGMMGGEGMMQRMGMHDETGRHRHGGMMTMPPTDATVEDVSGGVKLIFKPRDPHDLSELREQVSQHALMMRQGTCPMMRSMSDARDEAANSTTPMLARTQVAGPRA